MTASLEALVGIIANPASGKDIRRLVAHATTVDNQGKVGIIRRVLLGLGAVGARRVLVMPDVYRLTEQARRGLEHGTDPVPTLVPVDMPVLHRSQDSRHAAELMRAAGVGCIVVLGGDGTMRIVSQGAGEVPLLPISTGTNNVLPTFVEGTIAGLAAGILAAGRVPLEQVALRHKWFEIVLDPGAKPAVADREGLVERALIDIAVVRGRFVGARAVWAPDDMREVLVTRADPTSIGISAIAAMVRPVTPEEPAGLAVELDPDARRQVLAALGPGLLRQVGIAGVRLLAVGETLERQADESLMLALDGEREITLQPGQRYAVTLRDDGPWIVHPRRVMAAMVAAGLLER
jgi:predicted polyphosphate/ATP-dependent NAD kinase